MLDDLRDHRDGSSIACDVAIVGAGAAGITLARHLSGHGLAICLLESGGLDFERATQELAGGASCGMQYYDLVESRLRFFGGATNVWGGRCSQLEPIDFEPRPWVPYSGWPIRRPDLAPYYTQAGRDLDLGVAVGSQAAWADDTGRRLGLDPSRMVTRLWRFDEVRERFSSGRCGDVLHARDVRVVLHANLLHVQANADANAVTHLTVATLDGRRARVTARHYVLACGGIDNPRLLLASRDIEPGGVGNRHDQVGRYFMEHPHGRVGVLPEGAGFALWLAFQRRSLADGSRVASVLLPAPELQKQAGILNTAFTFKLQRDAALGVALRKRLYDQVKHQVAPTRSGRALWHGYRGLRSLVQRTVRKPIARARHAQGRTRVNVIARGEQAPNPQSRVLLDAELDALGVPRARLDWHLCALDKHTLRVFGAHLGRELERLGMGGLEPSAWLGDEGSEWPVDRTVSNHPIGGYHHMGTTRMADQPCRGVVDRDGRVHGYGNLYVAGSSVFPTGSWSNPTLTILALAHRLGDHLLQSR